MSYVKKPTKEQKKEWIEKAKEHKEKPTSRIA